ncbi:MAG TPA: helix-turn-helix transcriptional regulator [Acidobacteriota bacterium]|nr:helix-turn-helix transcriptional regulator [Acidobacteriota bacterium]
MEDKKLRQLGHRIRMARKTKSITQERLAELAGLSTTYIGRLERGEKTPSIDTLVTLSGALEQSPLDLLIDLDTSLGKEHIKNRIRNLLGLL